MNIAKDTAKRMLANIEQELQSLAAEQQSMNGNVGGGKMRKGGKVRYKMDGLGYQGGSVPGGGYTQKPKNWGFNSSNTGMFGFGQDRYNINWGLGDLQSPDSADSIYGRGAPKKRVALDRQTIAKLNTDNLTPQIVGKDYTDPKYGLTLGPNGGKSLTGGLNGGQNGDQGGMDLLGMLPGLFNTAAAIFSPKAQHINPETLQNPYEQQSLSMMPSQYRIDPQLNEFKNAYANNVRNINTMGNSRGERMANYGASMNQYDANVAGAYADKNNQENTMLTRKAMMMNDQGNQRAGVNMNVQNMNDQNTAAALNNRMAYAGAAASDFQRYDLVNKQMNNQQMSQQAYIRALMNMPHFKEWLGLDYQNPLGIQKKQ